MVKPITIVQGGQWGSEAKGHIAGYLCIRDKVDIAVRTGATNAGHTVFHNGVPFKAQQLPVGFVNPDTSLVIGAGALIDPVILDRECKEISALVGYDIKTKLKIDRRAGLHTESHALLSSMSGRHHSIGATGKGCSEALMDRIKARGSANPMLFGDSPWAKFYDVCDTEAVLNWSWNEGAKILLEGTQGQMLDLYLGPYPYTTHKQTGPAQWLLEAGLSPNLPLEIGMVIRTFPIRVAGNSGPMPQEISWPVMARELNEIRTGKGLPVIVSSEAIDAFNEALEVAASKFPMPPGDVQERALFQEDWKPAERKEYAKAASELNATAWKSLPESTQADLLRLFELTTVTKKLRRIARLDIDSLRVSARQIRPSWLAVTFMNYQFPDYWYKAPHNGSPDPAHVDYLTKLGQACYAPIRLASYGPEHHHIIDALHPGMAVGEERIGG